MYNNLCVRIVAIAFLMHMHTWAAASPLAMFEGKRVSPGDDCAFSRECLKPLYVSLPGEQQFYATLIVYNDAPVITTQKLADGRTMSFKDSDAAAKVAICLFACKHEQPLQNFVRKFTAYLEQTITPFYKHRGKTVHARFHAKHEGTSIPVTGVLMFPYGADLGSGGGYLIPDKDLHDALRKLQSKNGHIKPEDFYTAAAHCAQDRISNTLVPIVRIDVRQIADLMARLQHLPRVLEDY